MPQSCHPVSRICRLFFGGALSAVAIHGGTLGSQDNIDALPFGVGEHLEYQVRVSRVRASGRGVMSVAGPVELRGSQTWLLRFDFQAGLGPVKAMDRTESWLDPERMAVLRFHKHEKHPLSRGRQEVELYPDEQRWEGLAGAGGQSPTPLPLDELSFIYFVRTLPLLPDSVYQFDRHFQRDRNPITVRVLGRDTITTGIGELATVVVEMRVRDPARYREAEGVIRIHFTDDRRRLPARIESEMPVVGKAVMTLQLVSERPDGSGKP
jgi:hypothetical protein